MRMIHWHYNHTFIDFCLIYDGSLVNWLGHGTFTVHICTLQWHKFILSSWDGAGGGGGGGGSQSAAESSRLNTQTSACTKNMQTCVVNTHFACTCFYSYTHI